MRRILVLVLALSLASPALASLPKHSDSIRPLMSGERNICTTWALNRAGVWMTAAHCVVGLEMDEDGNFVLVPTPNLNIAGQQALIVKYDTEKDLAIIKADVFAAGIKLGKYPTVGDVVNVYGFPGAWETPLVTWLHVSAPFAMLDGYPWMILDGTAWPGHSGSPVLDKKGKVIGVLQAAGVGRYTGLSLASPWTVLKNYGEGFWEE